jgi:hypothetical protein
MATAESFTQRMDALAEALRTAGVGPDRMATILGSAATATMHALMLDAVLEENAVVPVVTRPPTVPAEPQLRIAA